MAIAWGGLVAGIGLIVLADESGPIRLAIAIALVGLAGFLAGVRCEDRRILHAIGGAIAGVAFFMVFVLITWVASRLGGPDRARLVPGGRDGWIEHVIPLVAAAVVGGAFAAFRLRPQGDARARRRYPEG